MPISVAVAKTPQEARPAGLTCLVVDVLRATSVMAVLLSRGVSEISVAPTLDAARRARDRRSRGETAGPLVCGEERALKPADFDFGNSPTELLTAELRFPEVILATTNGTPALVACREAALVMPAAPLNATASAEVALEQQRDVLIVCSGSHGKFAADDFLAAGLLVDRFLTLGATCGRGAEEAVSALRQASSLSAGLRETPHGRRLVELGFESDVDTCGQVDRLAVAGRLVSTDARELPLVTPMLQ